MFENDYWYHFAIVSDHANSKLSAFTDFLETSQSGVRYRKLSECKFFIGDKNGDSASYFEDTYISVRELRTWNEARTLGMLKYFSNRNLPK